jgi:hypothetical protein
MTHTLLLAAALAGPAQAEDKGPPVEIRPKKISNLDIGLSGASFDVVLEAERTRGIPVRLRSLDYTIQVGKVVVAEGERHYPATKLAKGKPVQIRVPVELSGTEALKAAGNIAGGRDLKIKVKGTAGLGIWFIPFKVPFSAKGP